jgi:hypothetical protein
MAAFLLLSASSDLTLADIEAWAARARTLGATAGSPVRFGEPPLAAERNGTLALSVPVTVSRTILPGDAPVAADDAADQPDASPVEPDEGAADDEAGTPDATTGETDMGGETDLQSDNSTAEA